jgi:hypothetical protein
MKELASLFTRESKTATTPRTTSSDSASGNIVYPLRLIDGRRASTIEIGLARLEMSYQQIVDAILAMDASALGVDKIKVQILSSPSCLLLSLKSCLPPLLQMCIETGSICANGS